MNLAIENFYEAYLIAKKIKNCMDIILFEFQ